MPSGIDMRKVVPAGRLRGDSKLDTRFLKAMLSEAKRYLSGFPWCAGIRSSWFGLGVGKVVAVFAFEIEPARPGVDDLLWVVVGDLPPAYLVVDDAPNPARALAAYVSEMRRWVAAVRKGASTKKLIPVNAPATTEFAEALSGRLDFLETHILSDHPEDLES